MTNMMPCQPTNPLSLIRVDLHEVSNKENRHINMPFKLTNVSSNPILIIPQPYTKISLFR